MDASIDHGSSAKGLAIDLVVTGSGLVGRCFSIPSYFLTMCSSLTCLSVVSKCMLQCLTVRVESL